MSLTAPARAAEFSTMDIRSGQYWETMRHLSRKADQAGSIVLSAAQMRAIADGPLQLPVSGLQR